MSISLKNRTLLVWRATARWRIIFADSSFCWRRQSAGLCSPSARSVGSVWVPVFTRSTVFTFTTPEFLGPATGVIEGNMRSKDSFSCLNESLSPLLQEMGVLWPPRSGLPSCLREMLIGKRPTCSPLYQVLGDSDPDERGDTSAIFWEKKIIFAIKCILDNS